MIRYGTQTGNGAWKLMRAFDDAGISAGFPAKVKDGHYTVSVANDKAREAGRVYMSSRWDE